MLTIGAAIIFLRSKTKWHSIVNWRCFSPINLFLKKIYYRHLLWKESEFHGKSTGVFGFSIYRAHKSELTIGPAIIFVRSKTKWHSIVNWRCFSPINLFLKKIYYRHLLWKESEFHGKSTWCFWIFHLPCTQISMAWFIPLFHLYILRAFFVIWPYE